MVRGGWRHLLVCGLFSLVVGAAWSQQYLHQSLDESSRIYHESRLRQRWHDLGVEHGITIRGAEGVWVGAPAPEYVEMIERKKKDVNAVLPVDLPEPRLRELPLRTWEERLDVARQASEFQPEPLLEKILMMGEAAAFAALEAANDQDIVLDQGKVERVLERATDSRSARAALFDLSRRKNAAARQAMARHAAREGPATDAARRYLGERAAEFVEVARQREARRSKLIKLANRATGRNAKSVEAIRALADFRDDEVKKLLTRLSSDWSPKVRQAAVAALSVQEAAKLPR